MDNEAIAAELRTQWPNIVNVIRASNGETLARLPVIGYICFKLETSPDEAHATVGEVLRFFFGSFDSPPAMSREDIERVRSMPNSSFWGTYVAKVNAQELVIALLERGHLSQQRLGDVSAAFGRAEEAFGLVSPENLIRRACTFYGVSLEDMLGPCRQSEIVRARHRLAFMLQTRCQLTLNEVGRRLGNRDHSTVLHATRKVRTELDRGEPGLRAELRTMARGWQMNK